MAAIGRTVLREQVKEVLTRRILAGDLRPGDRLVETRLAQELGTSQAPVREALRDLELQRLVESEPFRGSRVREVTDDELRDSFRVRGALEELAAREAAVRLDGEVGRLEEELDAMRAEAAVGNLLGQVRHDAAFHRLIVEASGNRVLLELWESLAMEGRTAMSLPRTGLDPAEVVELHVPIVEALRARDARRAGREARRHVERIATLFVGGPGPRRAASAPGP